MKIKTKRQYEHTKSLIELAEKNCKIVQEELKEQGLSDDKIVSAMIPTRNFIDEMIEEVKEYENGNNKTPGRHKK